MKKFLKNYDFEEYFDSHILYRGESYYKENRILDIWCQNNLITAYIAGSEIYKVELELDNQEILNSYCLRPYSEGGKYLCKHIAAILYYLRDNDIPELEVSNKSDTPQKSDKSKLTKIYYEMQDELNKISNRNGYVNYYNGTYFIDLISNVANYIDNFIDNEDYNEALELIKYTYNFIKDVYMDGSNGEYQESLYLINESASRLLYNDEYYDIFLDYTYEIITNNDLDDFSDSPLHAFILYVHDKKSAKKVVKLLDDIEFDYGIFVNRIINKISIIYDYLNQNDAIKLCYDNIKHYGVKELLISYLEKENKIDEIINLLKDDVKNNIRKENAYKKLLNIYEEKNMLEEKKKLLPEIIIETSSFKRYKELKDMCDKLEWDKIKEEIIEKIDPNKNHLLKDIYMEENEIDKLFDLIKKDPDILILERYQNCIKEKYSKELLNFYKPQILELSKRVSDRNGYNRLCAYIGKMSELSDSDDFIFEMIKEMYPYFKNRPAFKEEIKMCLSNINKNRFYKLIQK